MKKYLITFFILLNSGFLFSHCQVPCGIYDDAIRIVLIQEDFKTIKKAMDEINKFSKMKDAQSLNQLNRWISTKEEHSTKIQKIVSDYFLTQRIKSKNDNYVDNLKLLHQVLVQAMKCKQTTEDKYADGGLKNIKEFAKIYLDDHGQEHLDNISQ